MWSKIGVGATCKSAMGSWSTVGPMSNVWPGVEFGPWSSVGMCCTVFPGVKMGSHEHIPSGHIVTPFGRFRVVGYDKNARMFRLWDQVCASGGPRIISREEHEGEQVFKAYQAQELVVLLRGFLASRGNNTLSGFGLKPATTERNEG